jgi:hypothetical protein
MEQPINPYFDSFTDFWIDKNKRNKNEDRKVSWN